MAYLLAVPALIYGVNVLNSTVDDLMNFNYREYVVKKINRAGGHVHIGVLELEYKHANHKYVHYTNEYKRLIRLDEDTTEVKKARLHYFNMCKELRAMIADLRESNRENIA